MLLKRSWTHDHAVQGVEEEDEAVRGERERRKEGQPGRTWRRRRGRREDEQRDALEAELEERLCERREAASVGRAQGPRALETRASERRRTLFVLAEGAEDLCRVKHVVAVDDLVDVVGEEGRVEEERHDLERQEEAHGKECVRDHLGEDELRACVRGSARVSRARGRVRGTRRTWLSLLHRSIGLRLFRARENEGVSRGCLGRRREERVQKERHALVALEVGEHDDLRGGWTRGG